MSEVYEVRYENSNIDNEITETIEYVSADSLLAVVEFYTEFCEQYEYEFKLARVALTIVRTIESKEM